MSIPTLTELLAPVWTDHRDRVALELDERSWTYGELDHQIRRTEAWLISRKIGRGDRVAVLLDRGVPFIALYLATLRRGAICVPLNPGATTAEIDPIRRDAEPSLTVSMTGLSDRLQPDRGPVADIQELPSDGPLADGPGKGLAGPDDTAVLLFTSGTTGRPKGVMLTHANLASNHAALHQLWRWTAADVLVHTLPLHHVHGLFVALGGALLAGARTLLRPRFEATDALTAMATARATIFMGVPTMYNRFVQLPGDAHFDLSAARLFVSGSAPLTPTTATAFERRFGHPILERYGLTEVGMATSQTLDGPRPLGSVGCPLPGTSLRVVDPDSGQTCTTDAVGEVQIRGPGVFPGYWRNTAATAEAKTADGWLRSGDLGRLDAEGRLWLAGRRSELVITGGFNVYPREVEGVLDAHPDVVESVVWGQPDPDLGESLQAAVVPAPGIRPSTAVLEAWCRKRLSAYKCPRHIRFLDQLPRNAMGKILKRRLAGDPEIG